MRALQPGLYEKLLDDALVEAVADATRHGLKVVEEHLDVGDSHEFIARYVFETILQKLRGLPGEDKIIHQVALSNDLLRILNTTNDESDYGEIIAVPARLLRSVRAAKDIGGTEFAATPDIPLSHSDLLVNARDEPSVGHALGLEIASADRIDGMAFVLCSMP
jgi:hypothetical protein